MTTQATETPTPEANATAQPQTAQATATDAQDVFGNSILDSLDSNEDLYPEDYIPETGGSNWTKFEPGETRVRILTSATIGYEIFCENSEGKIISERFRRRMTDKELDLILEQKELMRGMNKQGKVNKLQEFNAFLVWNYNTKQLEVMSLAQKSIYEEIWKLDKNLSWGNCKKYDIIIKKEVKGGNTSYNVVPIPPAPIDDNIRKALQGLKTFDMEKIFDMESPFVA